MNWIVKQPLLTIKQYEKYMAELYAQNYNAITYLILSFHFIAPSMSMKITAIIPSIHLQL